MPNTKKILIALSIVLVVIIVIYIVLTGGNNQDGSNIPDGNADIDPTILANSLNLEKVPLLPADQGGGFDTDSPMMKDSAAQIAIVSEKLPYQKTLTTSAGITIDILIPEVQYQENKWTLSANIYGIDYEVPKEYPEYDQMKIAFREGVAHIFNFIKEQGGDPEKIVFKWGDRLFIDQRSIEWLQ